VEHSKTFNELKENANGKKELLYSGTWTFKKITILEHRGFFIL